MHWCVSILDRKLTDAEIRQRIETLTQWAKKTLPKDGNFNLAWLGQLMRRIDDLWYDGKLLAALTQHYNGLVLRAYVDVETVAGYVKENKNGTKIYLHMNRALFTELFAKKSKVAYHAGGLLCEDLFTCFLHVLLHESVHLLLMLCDKLGERKEINHHGQDFNRAIRNWFGHQEQQHGLIPGFHQTHDMDTIKKYAQPGALVDIFDNGHWIPARVVKRSRKHVEAKECCKSRGSRTLDVHLGLVRVRK